VVERMPENMSCWLCCRNLQNNLWQCRFVGLRVVQNIRTSTTLNHIRRREAKPQKFLESQH